MDKTTFFTFTPTVINDTLGLPRRFEGIAYSGGVIPGYGYFGDAAIDIASLRIATTPIFALVDHDPEKRAGKLMAFIEGNQIRISGEFFQSSEAGKEVAALFAEGAPWQMSVGLQAKSQSSDTAIERTVNGQKLKINTLFTDATLREVSFVPVGADPNTSVTAFTASGTGSEAAGGNHKKGNITMTLEELQAQVAALTEQVAAEKLRADTAETAVTEIKASARKDAIAKLSADIGRELSEAETSVFLSLDESAFITMSSAIKPTKPVAPDYLFSEQAIKGKEPVDHPSYHALNAELLAQVPIWQPQPQPHCDPAALPKR